MTLLERLAAILFVSLLWGCPQVCAAQQTWRVPAGTSLDLRCSSAGDCYEGWGLDVCVIWGVDQRTCTITAEQPSGDAILYVPEPSAAVAMIVGALALAVSGTTISHRRRR